MNSFQIYRCIFYMIVGSLLILFLLLIEDILFCSYKNSWIQNGIGQNMANSKWWIRFKPKFCNGKKWSMLQFPCQALKGSFHSEWIVRESDICVLSTEISKAGTIEITAKETFVYAIVLCVNSSIINQLMDAENITVQ